MELSVILSLVVGWIISGLPGLLGGALSWVFIFIILAPRVNINRYIKRRFGSENFFSERYPVQYRIGIQNNSPNIPGIKSHSVFEVSLTARLTVKTAKSLNIYTIPIEDKHVIELPVLARPTKNSYRWFVLCFKDLSNFNDAEIKKLGLKEDFSLEDLLSLQEAKITVYLSCVDEYTGQKKFFVKEYLLRDIKDQKN